MNDQAELPEDSGFSQCTRSLLAFGMIAPPSRPGLVGQVDDYEILRELGSGGMGIVYLARDARTGDQVALKMIRPGLEASEAISKGFAKELRALELMKGLHPHLMPVLAIHPRPVAPYYVMPYMPGGTLAQRIRQERRFSVPELLDILIPVAEAVACAHRRLGLIHCDIKPANILFDDQGQVYLSDYGLVRSYAQGTLKSVDPAQSAGTPAYMSPGVAGGVAEDGRRDIYALGAVMYEMMAGRPPYQGENSLQILQQVLSGPPLPLKSLCPELPGDLARIIEKAMARELRDRYSTMDDLVTALAAYRDGKSSPGPAGRWTGWLLAVAFGVAVALGGGWWLSQQRKEPPPSPKPLPAISPATGKIQAGVTLQGNRMHCGLTLTGNVRLPKISKACTFNADGTRLFVGSCSDSNLVWIVNPATLTLADSFTVGYDPLDICISPDGTVGYISNTVNGYCITKFDPRTLRVLGTLETGVDPASMVFSPDGSRLYTANHWSSFLSVIDVKNNQRIGDIPEVSNGSYDICISPDGMALFASGRSGGLYRISTKSNAVELVEPYEFGGNCYGANGLQISPDGQSLYVGGNKTEKLLRVDPKTLKTLDAVDCRGQINDVALHPGGKWLLVTLDNGQLLLVEAASLRIIGTVELPGAQLCAWSRDGKQAAATSTSQKYVSLFFFNEAEVKAAADGSPVIQK